MKLNDPVKVLSWLQRNPPEQELRAAFPAEWDAMEKELTAVLTERDPARLQRLLKPTHASTIAASKAMVGKRDKASLVQSAIKQRMAALAIERYGLAVATGRSSGKVRFNLFNGMLAQRFKRKPVSLDRLKLLRPPAQNTFEREVLRTVSVELYIVILSQYRFASGNWRDYESQKSIFLDLRPDLSRLALPPEHGTKVWILRRRECAL